MSTSLDASCVESAGVPGEHCCPRHPDWPTLAQHLLDELPDATISNIVREVRHARDAVEGRSIDEEEAVEVGEAIARNRLGLLAGRVVDVARRDSERHVRASSAGGA